MDPAFAERNVNEGFSGGEKKRHEILQLELLKPKFAILDETDSGLDIDALRVVSEGVNRVRETGDTGVLLITHYTRILRYIKPDFVHVFVDGRIVEEGGPELADRARRPRATSVTRSAVRSLGEPQRMTATTSSWSARTSRSWSGGSRRRSRWSTSTARTPRRSRARCIDALTEHYERHNANIHRATHALGAEATEAYEGARDKVAGVHRRRRPGRGGLHQELHRGAQPGREHASALAGPRLRSAPATRSSSPRWSTTPTSCRGSCCAQRTGATLRWFGVTDEGRLDLSRHRRPDQRAHQGRLARARVQHARHR